MATDTSITQGLGIRKVGFLGLGAMGSRMAGRLIDAGLEVRVWNRDTGKAALLADRGAQNATSVKQAVAGADMVISMLADDEASRAAWIHQGGAHALESGAIAVEASTVSHAWLGELVNAVRRAGGDLLEAPVVGSRPQAEAGQLIWLVAGAQRIFDRVAPVLSLMGSKQLVIAQGEASAAWLGKASAAKLAINGYFAAQVAAMAEMLAVLEASGINKQHAVDVVGQLPVVSAPLAMAARGMAASTYSPMFPIKLVEKDLRYYAKLLTQLQVEPLVGASVLRGFERSLAQGAGEEHITAIARLFETDHR